MKCRIVRYRVQPSEIEPVREAIRAFVAAIAEAEPETRYEAFEVDPPNTFVHVMCFASAEAEERHRAASYTERFVDLLYPRCEEPPDFAEARVVGSTR